MKYMLICGLACAVVVVTIVYAIASCFVFAQMDIGLFNPVSWTPDARFTSMAFVIALFVCGAIESWEIINEIESRE